MCATVGLSVYSSRVCFGVIEPFSKLDTTPERAPIPYVVGHEPCNLQDGFLKSDAFRNNRVDYAAWCLVQSRDRLHDSVNLMTGDRILS